VASGSAWWRRLEALSVAALLLLALALRVYRLDAQSLWNDEGTSVALAHRSLAAITRDASRDIHPPLYYYLLHGWMRLWGDGEWAVRSLSVCMGTAVVAVTYALARRLFSSAVAFLATLFVSVSPFHVYYSQEARMYIAVTLFCALATLAYARLLRALCSPWRGRDLAFPAALYVLATAAAVYSHYFAFSVVAAHNLALLLWLAPWKDLSDRPRRHALRALGAWVGLQTLIVALYVPWLVLSWSSLRHWPAVSEPLPLLGLLRRGLQVFALGVTVPEGRAAAVVGIALALPALAALVLCLRRHRADWGGAVVLAALYAFVPLAVMYALSLQRPLYKPKFLLLATPGYHLLQAVGILALGAAATRVTRWRGGGLAVGVALTLAVVGASGWSLHGLYTDSAFYRDDYRGIVDYIEATHGPRDCILINAPGQIETVDYYYDGALPMYPLPLQRPIDTAATEEALQEIVAGHERIYAILWATDESDPQRFIEGWLDRWTFKTLDSWFGNVRLVVYSVPEQPLTHIEHPLDVVLGDVARLVGYTLAADRVAGGQIVQLTLFWEPLRATEQPHKVFVHLLDARGNIVSQRDAEPAGGSLPTTGWAPGKTVVDHYGVLVQPGTPPGAALLRVGMYGAYDGRRLTVYERDEERGDAIDLTGLEITLPVVPPPAAALDMEVPHAMEWRGLRLLGHRLGVLGAEHDPGAALHPGDAMTLVLYWQRGRGEVPLAWELILRDRRGCAVWSQQVLLAGGMLDPNAWREGHPIRDVQVLHLGGELAPGTYDLFLAPAGEGGAYRLQRLRLSP